LYPWQRAVADVALERTGRDRWRYPRVTVSVPRQSGKTTLTALVCLARCLTQPDARVWYTAQSRMDAVDRWRDIVRLLRRSGMVELPARSRAEGPWEYRVKGAAGEESIEFVNGAQLRVFAPARDSLHGATTDLVVIDEARFFDEVQGRDLIGAIEPSQLTRDGQLWIVSTAGGPGSTFLAGEIDAGRASLTGRRSPRCHAEWSIGEDDAAGGDLLERVWAAHPAAGRRGGPRRDAMVVAADSMPAWQFAHEYGNRWQTVEDLRLLPEPAWRAGTVPELGGGLPVFGVDVAVDRSAAAIVACVDGTVQLVEHRPYADWVTQRVLDLVARWGAPAVVVDAAGPAGTVAEQLRPHLGDTLVVTSTRELAAACGGFYDAVIADPPGVLHTPNQILDDAVAAAARRSVGQAWMFDRARSGPAMLAMVLAWWAGQRVAPVERSQIWV
jgi:hypothetical protein